MDRLFLEFIICRKLTLISAKLDFFLGKKMNKVPPSFPLLENGGLPIVMQVYPRMYSGNNKVGIMERLNTSRNKKVQLNA